MFGFNDWHQWEQQGFRTRNAIIAKELAEHPDVGKMLVISTAKSIWINIYRVLKSGDLKNNIRQLALFDSSKASRKVYLLDHTRLCPREEAYGPYYRINGLLHDAYLVKTIRKLVEKLEMRNPLLWVSNPLMAKHIGRLGEKLSVFDAIDDWTLHPQKKLITKSTGRGYEIAAKKADIIFTVSNSLAKKLGQNRKDVYRISNGVNLELFQPRGYQVPPEMALLPRPIIGYVGALQERVNISILETIARKTPQSSLVLIGPLVSPNHFKNLEAYSNIHFLGEKPYEKIPGYLHFCDVCILPHTRNDFTMSMNPLKLYEYLAMGKPVVTTDIPGLEEFGSLIKRASSGDRFIQLINESVAKSENGLPERCKEFVSHRSWDKKVDTMLEIIEDYREASVLSNKDGEKE